MELSICFFVVVFSFSQMAWKSLTRDMPHLELMHQVIYKQSVFCEINGLWHVRKNKIQVYLQNSGSGIINALIWIALFCFWWN